jgi:hypothetical protein
MIHTAALVSSLAALGLTCAIHACTILAPRDSWLRAEVLTAILLSLLTGFFPLALGAALFGLWQALSAGALLASVLAGGADLLSLAAVVASVVVFRATLRAGLRQRLAAAASVTPFPPRPVGPQPGPQQPRKAA